MRQRAFLRHVAHEHRDRAPDRLIDVNDKNLLAIPNENRATATRGEHGANMHFNDRFIHRSDGTAGRRKYKLLQSERPAVASRWARPVRSEMATNILHVPRDQQLSDLQPLVK